MPASIPDTLVARPSARSDFHDTDCSRTSVPRRSCPRDDTPSLGHKARGVLLRIELRLFNRFCRRFGDGEMVRRIDVPAGTTLGELLTEAGIPPSEVCIAFVNGGDVSAAPGELRSGRVFSNV